MSTQSTSKPDPESSDDRDDAAAQSLPMAPQTAAPQDPPAAGAPDADPLAKWREAREMEEEMSDLFDEDRVVHRHGGTEPEAD
ncbi:MAG: hypothetical protein ABIO65_12380 [Nitrospiria bacterium]